MKTAPKKRGRKPKGGQITSKKLSKKTTECNQNIILHLNISTSEKQNTINPYTYYNKKSDIKHITNTKINENNNTDGLSISEKLKQLQLLFHHNNISKCSNCFWCTCKFNTCPIFIPINYICNKYNVYGNFCTPQCAAAYLFNEQIDSSVKFNRYALLNFIYNSIYNYTNDIIPAPDPRYILDKYYGNLSIEEYRKLISNNNDHIILINKPISKIFPELHNETTTKPEMIYKKYHNHD